MDCGEYHDVEYIMNEEYCRNGIPLCRKCGGVVKPDVVLYEDCLLYTSQEMRRPAIKMIKKRATSAFLIMINSGGKVDL